MRKTTMISLFQAHGSETKVELVRQTFKALACLILNALSAARLESPKNIGSTCFNDVVGHLLLCCEGTRVRFQPFAAVGHSVAAIQKRTSGPVLTSSLKPACCMSGFEGAAVMADPQVGPNYNFSRLQQFLRLLGDKRYH
jgi:hypothetical protein